VEKPQPEPGPSRGAPAANHSSEEWVEVRGKGKGKGKTSKGLAGQHSECSGGAANPKSVAPSSLRAVWAKDKRCLGCGSEAHWIASCPVVHPQRNTQKNIKQGVTGSTPAKPCSSSSAGRKGSRPPGAPGSKPVATPRKGAGEKRPRDAAPTGETPPAKRPVQKHSYAAVAAGSVEMAIVSKEKSHISIKCFNKLRDSVEDRFMEMLDQRVVPLSVEKWSYTPKTASIHLADSASVQEVRRIVEQAGCIIMEMSALEQQRKPTTVLVGLVTGTAARSPRETLERCLKFEKDRRGIPGRLEFYSLVELPSGNALLRIVVDDDAKEAMKEHGYHLRVGASGSVLFGDHRLRMKVDEHTRQEKINDLERQIEAGKKQLIALSKDKRELLEAETESVGSLGVSGLEVDEVMQGDNEEPIADVAAVDD